MAFRDGKLRLIRQLAAAGVVLCGACGPAAAHPHVWVGVETEIRFGEGKVTALHHKWTFDELYSADATQGLDKDGDGTLTREELAELAQVNMDGLKEVAYFTSVRMGDKVVETGPPSESWLEYKDGLLSLHFTLPLVTPIAADAGGFSFAVYDESFYIYLDYADANAARLGEGAPSGCKVEMNEPAGEEALNTDQQRLSDAFSQALGAGSYGATMSKTVAVKCAKS